MIQERYDLRVVRILSRKPMHGRALAHLLGIPPPRVVRILKRLEAENVVTYTIEGKNHVYTLKENEEAWSYLMMSEAYERVRILRKYPHLHRIFSALRKEKAITFALLFGSYARGTAREESDIDLYIRADEASMRNITLLDTRLHIITQPLEENPFLYETMMRAYTIIRGVEAWYAYESSLLQTLARGKTPPPGARSRTRSRV